MPRNANSVNIESPGGGKKPGNTKTPASIKKPGTKKPRNTKPGVTKPERAYHHGDLRDALVTAGMRLLEQRTSEELGLREVARAVGVSATAVYRHFPDKDALMRAIAARGFVLMGELQAEASHCHPGPTAFGASGAAYVRFALKNPAVFRLMFSRAPSLDLFALPPGNLPGPMRLLRENAAALTHPDVPASAEQTQASKVVSIRAWALVHGLAMLLLDNMVQADDALIDAIIVAANVA